MPGTKRSVQKKRFKEKTTDRLRGKRAVQEVSMAAGNTPLGKAQ
jgi:hypothetical protein